MRKKRSSRGQRPGYADYSDYYDEENRRSSQDRPQFQRYDEPVSYGGSQGRGQSGGRGKSTGRPAKRRRSSRYRLAHPEKLVFSLVIFLALVLLLVLLIKAIGGSSESENSGSSVQIIENVASSGETGTVRSVYNTDVSGIPNQMSAYMASMVHQNPNNFPKDPTKFVDTTVEEEIDPFAFDYFIAIDPGHGGTDTGHEMDGVKEKEIALIMSQKIAEYINSHAPKYYAFLTRTGDSNVGDQQRLNRAAQTYANLIVSVHCNGSEQELGGTTAAYWTGEGDDSTRAALSQELAESLMVAAADGFGMWYRETRIEDTPILRADVPSVQLELGFVTYGLDNELMSDEELQNAAAAKIGEELIQYMDEMAPDFVKKREQERQQQIQQQLNDLAGVSNESSQPGDANSNSSDSGSGDSYKEE